MHGASEVLVIGAGPAGAAAGIVLARAGIDVAVVDRARFPRDKTCGDAVSSGALRVLDELGVGEAVRAAAHARVTRARAVFPDGTRIERRYEPAGCIVPRVTLDALLHDALARAGARVLDGIPVRRLIRDGTAIGGAEGPGFSWHAPIVIAADGHASVGAVALGQRRAHGRRLGLSATAYYRGLAFPDGEDVTEHIFDPDLPYGYAWIFPPVHGVANVGVYLTEDAYQSRGAPLPSLFERFVLRHADRFRAATRVGRLRTWALPLAPATVRTTAPGLLFAGDAGRFVDPLTGEGIWQALHTGVLAGATAAEALLRGGLTPVLRLRYEFVCARTVGLPSAGRAALQASLRWLLATRLYRARPVRSAIAWGYTGRLFDLSRRNRG